MKKSLILLAVLLLFVFVACSDDDTGSTSSSSSSSQAANEELFISEYCEGPAYSKYIEIYNPSDSTVDLTVYSIWKYHFSGGDSAHTAIYSATGVHSGTIDKLRLNNDISGFSPLTAQWVKDLKVALPDTIAPNSAIVIYNYKITNTLVNNQQSLDSGNIMTKVVGLTNAYAVWDGEDNPKTFNFNGDDGLVLFNNTTGQAVDVFGPATAEAIGGALQYDANDPFYSIYQGYDVKYAQDHLYIRKPGKRASTTWNKADWNYVNLTVGTNDLGSMVIETNTNTTPETVTTNYTVTNMAWATNDIKTFHGQSTFQPDQDAGQHTP